MDTSNGWHFRAIVLEGAPVDIAGVNPWQAEWEPMPVGSVVVADPAHPTQQHTITVYRLSGAKPPTFFAAGEFSNAVWAFYEPTQSTREFLLTHCVSG
ncbi:hypothetical protein [Kribbella monticola]|uniref:hypothetical protein n=1 Tax=Kribbella monticola TaxID=2185285 RepID=UPI000DD4DD80|nr:hypothetical protein [Kribbella monticola]